MPSQTHYVPRTLQGSDKPDRDVQVMFATNPGPKAILFIHGFSGKAIATWSDFHELLPDCSACADRDLYFYGYDGLRAGLIASASIFRGFLGRVFEDTGAFLAKNLPSGTTRPAGFQYEELTIVAHSLGAVIARRALLDATRSGKSWPTRTGLILFAPAHSGARVVELAVEATSRIGFLGLFASAARFKSPLIDELDRKSPQLANLLKETLESTEGGRNPHLIAKRVVIAEYDEIVFNDTFGNDPAPESIPNTTHTSVCKPRSDFRQPLVELEKCL